MALPDILRCYTPEEYLALEREADFKSEYIDGYIRRMIKVAPEHSLIKVGLMFAARDKLPGSSCKTYDSDMQVQVDPGLYTYPDLSVVCGESLLDDANNLLNPVVIFEVLSPSTEAYDRGEKFSRYQGIPSLRQYVLVSQSRPRIEVFTRQNGEGWILHSAGGLESSIDVESIACTLPLAEVYAQVTFAADAPPRASAPRPAGR